MPPFLSPEKLTLRVRQKSLILNPNFEAERRDTTQPAGCT
jgi:hypothetical protein